MFKTLVLAAILVLFVNSEILPFDNGAVEKIFQNKQAALFLFTTDNQASTSAKEAFTALDATGPSVLLTLSDKNDGFGLFDRLAQYLGIDVSKTPSILYMGEAGQKYIFEQSQVTQQSLSAFIERVKAGQVTQFLKSAPIPESNDQAVKVLVGKTFDEYVMDSQKQVLVKFYAPWCGHCKTLAPHYDQAAQRIANNPNILIAKVDSTLNEVAGVDIQGFPTLKFWGKDKSQPPIDFNGQRSADGIIQWLKDHTQYEWVDQIPAGSNQGQL